MQRRITYLSAIHASEQNDAITHHKIVIYTRAVADTRVKNHEYPIQRCYYRITLTKFYLCISFHIYVSKWCKICDAHLVCATSFSW